MTTPLFDPPDNHPLPVSWHGDLVVDFESFDPDDAAQDPPVWTPLAYEPGVRGYLDVKTEPPQRFEAVITDHHAVVKVESEVADEFKNRTLWVFLLSYPSAPTTEIPVVNGVIDRYDGKPRT